MEGFRTAQFGALKLFLADWTLLSSMCSKIIGIYKYLGFSCVIFYPVFIQFSTVEIVYWFVFESWELQGWCWVYLCWLWSHLLISCCISCYCCFVTLGNHWQPRPMGPGSGKGNQAPAPGSGKGNQAPASLYEKEHFERIFKSLFKFCFLNYYLKSYLHKNCFPCMFATMCCDVVCVLFGHAWSQMSF